MFPVDFKFEEINTLIDIINFSKKLDAKTIGIHVWEADEELQVLKNNLDTYKKLFQYRMQNKQILFELRPGNLSELIPKYIKAQGVDILCMMISNQNSLKKFFQPSSLSQ